MQPLPINQSCIQTTRSQTQLISGENQRPEQGPPTAKLARTPTASLTSLSFRGCASIFSCKDHKSASLGALLTGAAIVLVQRHLKMEKLQILNSVTAHRSPVSSQVAEVLTHVWALSQKRLENMRTLLQIHTGPPVDPCRSLALRRPAPSPFASRLPPASGSPAPSSYLNFSWLWLSSPTKPAS